MKKANTNELDLIRIEYDRLSFEYEELRKLINNPITDDFVNSVLIEAAYQKEQWSKNDKSKTDVDWFWLIGYLAGKALFNPGNSLEKQKHRIISIAAAACNWWSCK